MQPRGAGPRAERTRLPVVAALVAMLACGSSGPVATVHTQRGPVRVALEVVADDASRARGLMYRDRLDDGHGMLFVFDDEAERSFWMKNTVIPLDMIFIGADRTIVGVYPNATPLTLTPRSVGRPSKWVLEVAGGYAARAGIETGNRVDLDGMR
jgi:uncharacterized membrane protein (UPF0127 family)